MPATATYSLTGNAYIDGLLGNAKWAISDLTFSFPASASHYHSGYGYGEPTDNFGALNATQQATARAFFDMYASVSNLTFTEITETSTQHAALRLASSDAPSTAWAYYPTTADEGGDSWFNASNGYYDSPAKGNYAHTTFLHEIGHALGLEHPHEGNVMPTDRDSMEYTVMSYRSYVGGSTSGGYTNEKWGYAQSLMMYDIAALQHMYGAGYITNGGNTTYSWSPTTGEMFINGAGQGAPGGNRIFLTVWDGGGVDTYDFSSYTTNLSVDLRPGEWTTTSSMQLAKLHYDGSQVAAGNIANALLHNNDPRSLIENANGGSGNDTLIGNLIGNFLRGGEGQDLLLGWAGDDQLYGEIGDDLMGGGAGADLLEGGLGHDGLDGGDGDDRVIGGEGNDHLVGEAGADYLSGGAGADLLLGGLEGDVIDGDGGNDLIGGGAGWDLIRGGAGDDAIDGGSGNDWLYGGEGADVLDGDIGGDHLYGGSGSDVFRFRDTDGAVDTIYDFIPNVDHLQVQTGRSVADVIASARVTDGGSTIVDIGNDTLLVVSGVIGIEEGWFV